MFDENLSRYKYRYLRQSLIRTFIDVIRTGYWFRGTVSQLIASYTGPDLHIFPRERTPGRRNLEIEFRRLTVFLGDWNPRTSVNFSSPNREALLCFCFASGDSPNVIHGKRKKYRKTPRGTSCWKHKSGQIHSSITRAHKVNLIVTCNTHPHPHPRKPMTRVTTRTVWCDPAPVHRWNLYSQHSDTRVKIDTLRMRWCK